MVNVEDADPYALVEEAAAGEEIILVKAGEAIARLMPISPESYDRQPGRLRHLIKMKGNFDDPVPPEIAEGLGMD